MIIRNNSATDIGVGSRKLGPGETMPSNKTLVPDGNTFADPLLESFRRAGALSLESKGRVVVPVYEAGDPVIPVEESNG